LLRDPVAAVDLDVAEINDAVDGNRVAFAILFASESAARSARVYLMTPARAGIVVAVTEITIRIIAAWNGTVVLIPVM
jgi:hypothetical protein